MQDPRPRSVKLPDGTVDMETERRFEVLFEGQRPLTSPRPTDLASALVVINELIDRLAQR